MAYTLKERLTYTLAGMAMLGLVVVYALEFAWFNRTLDISSLAFYSMGVGGCLGLALGHYAARKEYGLTEKIQIYIFFGLSCTIFGPLAGSLSNRLLSPPAKPTPVEFVSQSARYASRSGPIAGEKPAPNVFEIEFYYRQEIREITSLAPYPNTLERGDTVLISIKPGLWGCEVIQKKAAVQ
ncbi:MAG: hypothetical protein ACE362_14250 [Phaeodactylibacter xiamenensis]|uniref:Uncharacterized protein n=1 Tax=Phaeodactylibacter xiamenensis TaxID=1524460 RepID=A0A098S315_9BACT|nr:hypothetical protein [Phaeodactylibacter xiamenensis]KGE86198.1 hypothetical protein IX84_22465 [Phaeodactylibacter xiamenensis]MCR9053040.1 hypothetical protein [bacterium]